MYTIKENEKERALIISLAKKDKEKKAKFEELNELESLAKTAGAIPIEKIVQIKEKPDTATFIGKGKANYLKDIDVDILLFNESLSPAQISNLEEITEKKVLDKDRVIFAREIPSNKNRIEKVLSKLSQNVYITIDLDVFDPSIMPSTGTPEPGGLLWYDVLGLLRTVFENRNVIGFDVVELYPDERNKAPDFLAAKLIYKMLSYKFRG